MNFNSMVPIASCRGVDIYIPTRGKFSFMKSPYPAHSTHSAVDIYPGVGFGDQTPSPVEGTVIDIREYSTPTLFIGRDSKEYLIAIEQGDSVVRILHVRPLVKIGDEVSPGDPLGTLIYNGYFYFWNDPVSHVEIRPKGDYIRASNNNPIESRFTYCSTDKSHVTELNCTVVFCEERYALLSGEYDGQKVKGYRLGGCLLDGLLPVGHLQDIDYFGLVGESVPVPFTSSAGNRYMLPSGSARAAVPGKKNVLALGFSLSCSFPFIKAVPERYGQRFFQKEEEVVVRLSLNGENEVKDRHASGRI